jgi:predicted PurR-regulated permease PerM
VSSTYRPPVAPEPSLTPPPSTRRPARPATAKAPGAHLPERGSAIGGGLTWLATWSLRLLLVAGAAYVLGFLVGRLWSVLLPIMLALLLASVLWPPTAWLRRRGAPAALAAVIVLLGSLGLLIGIFAILAPSVAGQLGDIADQAIAGIGRIQTYITEPPLNLNDAQVNAAVQQITTRLQGSASALASSALAGVSAVGSGLVTTALALVLAFFFIKDGPNFLPWLGGVVGERAGRHLDTVLSRSWVTLGSFIQGQAAVGLIDAVLIGIGLVVLGVPLALPLAVLTFFGGFVPIIGAFVVGALAVLVALVTTSLTTALILLAIILAVQQIEGNVLQPMLQGRSLRLHPGLVLVAVAAGSTLFGIAGAFLSVPVAAVAAVILRYLGEVIDGRPADEARAATTAESDADTGAQSSEPDEDRPEDKAEPVPS